MAAGFRHHPPTNARNVTQSGHKKAVIKKKHKQNPLISAKLERQRRVPVKKQRHSSWSEENVSRSAVVVVVVIVARTSSSLPYLLLLLLLLPCPSLLRCASRTTHAQRTTGANSRPAGQLPWGQRRREGRREFGALFSFLAKFSELGF